MHYDMSVNGAIKQVLVDKRITYEDIGRIIHYSGLTIRHWLAKPLSPAKESMIWKAIAAINRKED